MLNTLVRFSGGFHRQSPRQSNFVSTTRPRLRQTFLTPTPIRLVSVTSRSHEKENEINFHEVIHHAADYLPHQGIIENFIHHNPLKALEASYTFDEAVDHVKDIQRFMTPGDRAFAIAKVDPRKRVKDALVELSSVFLDRGAAKWAPGFRDKGFLYFFAKLESLGPALWRKHARSKARDILKQMELNQVKGHKLAESIIKEELEALDVHPTHYSDAVRNILLELRGWAGMFHRMESRPHEAPRNTKVHLMEYFAVQLILLRSSIESLASKSDWDSSTSLSSWLNQALQFKTLVLKTRTNLSSIAYLDQIPERRKQLEKEFEQSLLYAIQSNRTSRSQFDKNVTQIQPRPSTQLYTCIDDRCESLRRHVEEVSGSEVETFGVAGFFGLPIRFRSIHGQKEMILAPDGQNPSTIITEKASARPQGNEEVFSKYKTRRKLLARLSTLWEAASFSPIGSLALSLLAPFSLARLAVFGLAPDLYARGQASINQYLSPPKTDFDLPYSASEAAVLLSKTFKDVGTSNSFAPLVVILGHGAKSLNNPFYAAYNCGACSGREGGPNARLFARLANNPGVRLKLKEDHGVSIPDDTWFIAGVHNTTTDVVEYFDIDDVPHWHLEYFSSFRQVIAKALGKNALERCHRFLLAENVRTPEQALEHVGQRATDFSEIRPELNHATNASVIIGRRELTQGCFLDRRIFLPSYDPLTDDDNGTNLERVMRPALNVCSGINLEYLFSTTHGESLGAGTKVPLNVVGNIGVLQGTQGDLRPGLPTQMTEMHTPLRSLFLIDAPVARVESVLNRNDELRFLVRNDWIRLIVRDPFSGEFFRHNNGSYETVVVEPSQPHISFLHHRNHGLSISLKEKFVYRASVTGMIASCVLPVYAYGAAALNPLGPLIALLATAVSLPTLGFARRYLHGEFMFPRIAFLSVGLLTGFNLVATASSMAQILQAWSLFGFSSAFLIGSYNDRVTVRNNTTFIFSIYRLSDFALLVATTFAALPPSHPSLVAAGLLMAALLKSSQFPLTSVFVRSMEGPTPTSALGYSGLSAHIGVVLLASTMSFWFPLEWARIAVGSLGLITAIFGTLTSKIRSDRKGALANMTAATIGLIYVVLALGYSNLALFLSLGHASFRMIQCLQSPNQIFESQNTISALGYAPWPHVVPSWLFRFSWILRRFKSDVHFFALIHKLSRPINQERPWALSKWQQWLATTLIVAFTGFPYTPLSHGLEHWIMDLLPTHPIFASVIMITHWVVSVVLIRFLFVHILNPIRFQLPHSKSMGQKLLSSMKRIFSRSSSKY